MPYRASWRAVLPPTPHRSFAGIRSNTSATFSGAMTVRPSGFCISLASLARSLFGAMPMEQVMPKACLIRALIR